MSAFPITLGAKNGGNSRVIRGLTNGVIRDAFTGNWWWVQCVKSRGTDVHGRAYAGNFTPEADTSQTIDFSTAFPANPFPTNVIRKKPVLYVEGQGSGGLLTDIDVIWGDTDDDNGLLTVTNVFTDGTLGYQVTTGAAQFADRLELDYAGDGHGIIITTVADEIDDIEDMILWFMLEFTPLANPF